MTDEEPLTVEQLRDEFAEQFSALKSSFEQAAQEKDELIAQLKQQNVELQRALVRSAVTEPPKQEVPKTEEELYKENIERLSQRTINIMRSR